MKNKWGCSAHPLCSAVCCLQQEAETHWALQTWRVAGEKVEALQQELSELKVRPDHLVALDNQSLQDALEIAAESLRTCCYKEGP